MLSFHFLMINFKKERNTYVFEWQTPEERFIFGMVKLDDNQRHFLFWVTAGF